MIELTANPKKARERHQHAGIAAGELDTTMRGRAYYQRTVARLPLNQREELEQFLVPSSTVSSDEAKRRG